MTPFTPAPSVGERRDNCSSAAQALALSGLFMPDAGIIKRIGVTIAAQRLPSPRNIEQ